MNRKGRFNLDRFEIALADSGLSLAQLAAKIRVDRRTLDKIRSGETQEPWPSTVKQIAQALNIADASALWIWSDHSVPAGACNQAGARADSGEDRGADPDPDHPFDPWSAAVPPAFVGRADILRALERAAREGQGVSLVGEWRIGKTSILRTWAATALGMGLRVRLVSGQGPEGAGQRALVAGVIAQDRPDPERAATAALDSVPDTADGAADRLAAWCVEGPASGEVGRRGPGLTRPILLVDEAEQLLDRCEPRFLERLRGLLSARRLSLVLATRRTLDAVYKDLGRTSPFPNVLSLQRVGLLDGPSARALIARGADRWQVDDPDWLLDWAGAHPFYLSLLARRLYEARGTGEPRDRALDRFREEAEGQIRLWWPGLPERYQTILRRAARGEPVDDFRLRQRGLLTDDNCPFAKVFGSWLNEQS